MTLRAALIVSAALMGATSFAWAQGAPAAARLLPRQLALVVNDAEPNSVTIAEYYRKARAIPAANIIHVSIPGKPQRLDAARFRALKDSIDSQLPAGIEAVLMVWTAPYAVECNAITAAYTMGFDPGQCSNTCAASRPSAYFNATSAHPVADFRMRLSMLLPTESVAQAKAVIDRGVVSGFRVPNATAYYLVTSQAARNSRAELFPRDAYLAAKKIRTKTLHADTLEGVKDIMIYQTGMAKVDKLDSLGFLPGALADHLTSFGGDLLGTSQMSSLRWLEAGATASYGSVSEPCNHWQKFPHPTVLLKHYLNGSSAIEAYWRSVAWPTQGVFVGEPLAAPYGR
ncbi:TIGR03790 family protein [Massilia antarctica]|uniref:TIGR03790 family protein n=1 Tax=Massilia antarctica TaxID=2765360 RepID=A0AA48W976_9BURK|nr:TIGR03790 family protein [Massilia antarctica]QPI47324.1 TIGR03790 family protein [Massilia antarctica]